MTAGNEITVSLTDGSSISASVAAATGESPVITNGATAVISVTSVGDRGPKGDTGPANALSIGTVTSGTAAAASITGSTPNQILSLIIPKGDTGPQGTPGAPGTFADAQSISTVTASYSLVASDAGKLLSSKHSATPVVITVPPASSVAFPAGTHIDLARTGDAGVSVLAASGVTVNGTPGLKLRARYSAATLIKLATDEWLLVGDVSS